MERLMHWFYNWLQGRRVVSREEEFDKYVEVIPYMDGGHKLVVDGKEYNVLKATLNYSENWPYRLEDAIIEFAYDVGRGDGANTRRGCAWRYKTEGGSWMWQIEKYDESILPPLRDRE